jgi:hypothetical protein
MAKNSGTAKILLVLGGLLGLFSVFFYFIEPSWGAWWQVEGPLGSNAFMSIFGLYEEEENITESTLGVFGILAAIIFIIGAVCVFILLFKDNKSYGFIGSFLMIGGVVLFLIGLNSVQDYEDILNGISFLTGTEHTVFFGSAFGFSWGLSIGFFLGVAAIILSIIGSVVL